MGEGEGKKKEGQKQTRRLLTPSTPIHPSRHTITPNHRLQKVNPASLTHPSLPSLHNKPPQTNRVQHAELALRPGWSALLLALHQLLCPSSSQPPPTTAGGSGGGNHSSSSSTCGDGGFSKGGEVEEEEASVYGRMLLTAFHREYAGSEGAGAVLACLGT